MFSCLSLCLCAGARVHMPLRACVRACVCVCVLLVLVLRDAHPVGGAEMLSFRCPHGVVRVLRLVGGGNEARLCSAVATRRWRPPLRRCWAAARPMRLEGLCVGCCSAYGGSSL